MTSVVSTYGDLQALDAVRAKDGKYQMIAQSVSGILAGAAGGDFNKALAGGLNPVMAQVIKGATTKGDEVNEPANLMAHAVWGALAAQLSGGNAAAGAAGAFSGELAARHIAAEMFPDTKPGDLNQDQKQLVSLLGTMAAGIAGGVVGNSTAAATTGAQAGKNAVENNMMAVPMPPPALPGEAGAAGAASAGAVGYNTRGSVSRDGESWDEVGGGCEGTREQCAVRDGTRDGTRGPGHVMNGAGDDEGKQPNIAKDMTAEEKKEIGGTGSSGGNSPKNDDDNRNKLESTGSGEKNNFVKDYKVDLDKGDKVNLELFNQRKSVSGGKADFVDPKTGWRLSPDRAGNNSHGGSAWKLLDKNGNRIATLDKNGNVLRK